MRKTVGLLYTGGTIGCDGSPLVPVSGQKFRAMVAAIPWFNNGIVRLAADEIACCIEWTGRPADSSDLMPLDWLSMARWVLERYDRYDGFVILHGTDTMSWSASACCRGFQNRLYLPVHSCLLRIREAMRCRMF
ncbi:MAG: asparaginase domain-containing protein [Chlorobium sp.]|nr:asparaginase domain-containing protein [Chlorobium sp.]MCF8270639.1 asparaginase domain-containing protein [Chlorobium sp.]MCF8286975.1 asparaginase domain-containing protein [Chlorobium sp.]MCF8290632.1 asparaginase domain-containing protein [Chlorobium sp.]MCF8384773.1 asparaginase domain-containing protein [Chlorobium sp.]